MDNQGSIEPRFARADSHDSQTASDFIDSQLKLEADAREALPYAFDHCTQPLGPLRQNLFSCLTCTPPSSSPSTTYTPAAVCYSCSIACHGEHELVELFNRRNFTCDCGTTRLPATSPCTLRIDPSTGVKGPVHSQPAAEGNTYNQNCRNRFCGCGELYDAHAEKGTMFQCLGLAGENEGGCGEDWWHPECVLGLGREWSRSKKARHAAEPTPDHDGNGSEETTNQPRELEHDDEELPPGFPAEDDFETFICYKCVDANPWIKRYASSTGFLPPVLHTGVQPTNEHTSIIRAESPNHKEPDGALGRETVADKPVQNSVISDPEGNQNSPPSSTSLKRRADDDDTEEQDMPNQAKKIKLETNKNCYYETLPEARPESLSIFLKEDFRDHLCRCANCYIKLRKHPQLLEEEESYEPPSRRSRFEQRRSKGVMVYNHLKDKVKSFLQPFAESGQAVGAEDIKAYFEKLRGDEQAIKTAAVAGSGESGDGDNRREQSG
ncbi:MAG: hypothetical protein Q9186_001940 [Xanthomendoza sp. 1 TL-2023]